jgi:hypothetical protein
MMGDAIHHDGAGSVLAIALLLGRGSTMTEPGFIAFTISSVMRMGARFQG